MKNEVGENYERRCVILVDLTYEGSGSSIEVFSNMQKMYLRLSKQFRTIKTIIPINFMYDKVKYIRAYSTFAKYVKQCNELTIQCTDKHGIRHKMVVTRKEIK